MQECCWEDCHANIRDTGQISEFGKYSSNPIWETITCFSHPWKCETQCAIISSYEGLIVWEISLIKNTESRQREGERRDVTFIEKENIHTNRPEKKSTQKKMFDSWYWPKYSHKWADEQDLWKENHEYTSCTKVLDTLDVQMKSNVKISCQAFTGPTFNLQQHNENQEGLSSVAKRIALTSTYLCHSGIMWLNRRNKKIKINLRTQVWHASSCSIYWA